MPLQVSPIPHICYISLAAQQPTRHKFDFAHLADAIIREKEQCEGRPQTESDGGGRGHKVAEAPRVPRALQPGPAAMAAAAAAQYHGGFR